MEKTTEIEKEVEFEEPDRDKNDIEDTANGEEIETQKKKKKKRKKKKGGLIFIGVIIGIGYFCYRTKRKRYHGSGPGILGRLGMRSTNNQPINAQAHHIPRRPPIRLPIGRPSNSSHTHCNPAFINSVPMQAIQPPSYYSPNYNTMQCAPMAPTAPMPPPYEMDIAPPPYFPGKVPPPPEYSAVLRHNTMGHKDGSYSDGMPPPVD